MTRPIQLKLWSNEPDRLLVQCTNCGHRFDALPQVKRAQDVVDQVMAHPSIRSLTKSQREFLKEMPADFLDGERRLGITDMSDWVGLTVQGAQYHVRTLAARGIIVPEPKRAGGRYHVYRFAFPNGNTPA